MSKTEIINRIQEIMPRLRSEFGVTSVSMFGSASRDEMRPESDIDLLVKFDPPVDFDRYFDVKELLELTLGHSVDLATEAMIKPLLRTYIERDLVHVA